MICSLNSMIEIRECIFIKVGNLIFTLKKVIQADPDSYYVLNFGGHKGAVSLHTDTVFAVPVQLEPWWTGTLIAPQRVDAPVFTASTIDAAFVNIYE